MQVKIPIKNRIYVFEDIDAENTITHKRDENYDNNDNSDNNDINVDNDSDDDINYNDIKYYNSIINNIIKCNIIESFTKINKLYEIGYSGSDIILNMINVLRIPNIEIQSLIEFNIKKEKNSCCS